MIPPAEAILEAWPFLARRLGSETPASEPAVRAALEHAAKLAQVETDEPAAMFYAFACRPRTFPGFGRVMTRTLAANHARVLGLVLHATAGDLDALCGELAHHDRPAFDDVRTWFAARLLPVE